MIVGDTPGGDYHSSPIFAFPAVDENRPAIGRIQHSQDAGDLFIGGRGQSRHWHIDITEAELFRRLLLPVGVFLAMAKIDDCFHAEVGERLQPFGGGLSASIDVLIDLMKILHAWSIGTCRHRAGNRKKYTR